MGPKTKKLKTGKEISQAADAPSSVPDVASPSLPVALAQKGDTVVIAKEGDAVPELAPAPTKAITSRDSIATAPSSKPTVPVSIAASPTKQLIIPSSLDDKRLNIDNLPLLFTNVTSALGDGLIGRETLNIADDDVESIKSGSQPKEWVQKLMLAFGKDYLTTPEGNIKRSPAQKEWYLRWQKQAHAGAVAIFEMKDPAHLEKCCWFVFDTIIKAHELGVFTVAANNWAPSGLKCSERLAVTVEVVGKYAPMRLDVLRLWHVEEIAANPEMFIKRKLVNCWNNGHRAERYGKAEKTGKTGETGKAGKVGNVGEEGGEVSADQATVDVDEEPEQSATGSRSKSKKPGKKNGASTERERSEEQAAVGVVEKPKKSAANSRAKRIRAGKDVEPFTDESGEKMGLQAAANAAKDLEQGNAGPRTKSTNALPPQSVGDVGTAVEGSSKVPGRTMAATKRAHSPTPEGANGDTQNKKTATRKRPTGRKAPAGTAT